jgi:hypothetical protein
MDHTSNTPMPQPDKAAIDASERGSLMISADLSSRVSPSAAREIFVQLQERVEQRNGLVLSSLRCVLLTAELPDAVRHWQRVLGLPESSVSQQPEGNAVAKTFSWGRDLESARSLIIVADYIAAAAAANNSVAIATIVHEFGHVHDELASGIILGFPNSYSPPVLNDWPAICAYLAKITWSEYRAESIAAGYLTSQDLRAFLLNDPCHLAGIDERLRQSVRSYKLGQRSLASLWNESVTEISDILANLGRAIARLAFAPNYDEALARIVRPSAGAIRWQPVIEHLARELKILGDTAYDQWPTAPFHGIQEAVQEAFGAVDLFPSHPDGKELFVRVT